MWFSFGFPLKPKNKSGETTNKLCPPKKDCPLLRARRFLQSRPGLQLDASLALSLWPGAPRFPSHTTQTGFPAEPRGEKKLKTNGMAGNSMFFLPFVFRVLSISLFGSSQSDSLKGTRQEIDLSLRGSLNVTPKHVLTARSPALYAFWVWTT